MADPSLEFPDYSEQTAQGMLGTNPMLEAGLVGFLGIRHTGCGAGWVGAGADIISMSRRTAAVRIDITNDTTEGGARLAAAGQGTVSIQDPGRGEEHPWSCT